MGQEPRTAGSALRALRWGASLAVALALAQTAEAQIRLVSAKAGNDSPEVPAYVDRVIEGLAADSGTAAAAEVPYDAAGWPRFLRLETRLGSQPGDGGGREVGVSVTGAVETPNHGTISVDANVAREGGNDTVTLRQRALPVSGGWLVNNELGVLSAPAPELMRLPSRVFVPVQFSRGASTEWLNAGSGTQLMAANAEPGQLQGFPVSGFRRLPGTLTTVGAQTGAGAWSAAVRHVHADAISSMQFLSGTQAFVDAESTQVALRGKSGPQTVQLNAVESRTSDSPEVRRGIWVDGEWKRGSSLYGWGFFRLDPNLSWAGQGMASDIKGGYARASWSTRQWSAESSVDVLNSVSGREDTGVLVTSTGRWRYSRSLSLGAGATVRRFQGNAGTAFAEARFQSDWGQSGVRAERGSGAGPRYWRLVLDHAWVLPQGWAASTSVSAGRESGDGSRGALWGAATSFAVPVGNDVAFQGNASAERQADGSYRTSANLGLNWRLAPRWTLEGNFLYTRGRDRLVAPLDPLAPVPETLTYASDARSFFLVLRYEDSAGTRMAPLGGSPRTGGGAIEGVVYLDANRSGTREASEKGAAGVTVYLDGRYAVRTDSQGRFAFPFVAPGARVITVLNETLPLPWETDERSRTRIEVVVRETSRVEIPVVRRGPD